MLPRLQLGFAIQVAHAGRRPARPTLAGLRLEFEGLELDVRFAFLDFLRPFEEVPVLLVQPFDLGLEVRLHVGQFLLSGAERLLLPSDVFRVGPDGGFFHLRVLEKFRVLLRPVIDAFLRFLDSRRLSVDLRGPLSQRRFLVRNRLFSRHELSLAILVHPALTLELLVDPRRVLVPFAELALERPEFDLLLADLLLLGEDLGLPFFQLSDPGRLRRRGRAPEPLRFHADLGILQLQFLLLLQEGRTGRVE